MANNYYTNPDEQEKGGTFGYLTVKKYLGTNKRLVKLNELKTRTRTNNIGQIQVISETLPTYDSNGKVIGREVREFWYLHAIDGETYRGLEPADGIDSLFNLEFKRQNLTKKVEAEEENGE